MTFELKLKKTKQKYNSHLVFHSKGRARSIFAPFVFFQLFFSSLFFLFIQLFLLFGVGINLSISLLLLLYRCIYKCGGNGMHRTHIYSKHTSIVIYSFEESRRQRHSNKIPEVYVWISTLCKYMYNMDRELQAMKKKNHINVNVFAILCMVFFSFFLFHFNLSTYIRIHNSSYTREGINVITRYYGPMSMNDQNEW